MGAHASSSHKKSWVSGRQVKAALFRKEVDILRGSGKEKLKVPILAKPNKQLIRR
jgi:hypothetical protein